MRRKDLANNSLGFLPRSGHPQCTRKSPRFCLETGPQHAFPARSSVPGRRCTMERSLQTTRLLLTDPDSAKAWGQRIGATHWAMQPPVLNDENPAEGLRYRQGRCSRQHCRLKTCRLRTSTLRMCSNRIRRQDTCRRVIPVPTAAGEIAAAWEAIRRRYARH